MPMNIIQTDNLTKKFNDLTAVDNVSIHVRAGEIYGFLGLNGAGKTTAIRLMLGMINPNAGSVQLFGRPLKQASKLWNDVGYLVETSYSYPNLSVKENLEVIYRLRGLSDKNCIDVVIDKLQLSQYKNVKAKHLSMGNNQRLGLAKALIHKPKLLILDEPINGLDPAGIVEIREFLKDLVNNHNTTIFLSSHILSEIAKVATRIGIVNNGKLVKEINSNELEHQIIRKLCIRTADNPKALDILKANGYTATITENDVIEISDNKALHSPETVASLIVTSQIPLKMLQVIEEDLESYFLRIIGK